MSFCDRWVAKVKCSCSEEGCFFGMGAAGPTCGPRLGTRAERLRFAVRCSRFAIHLANLGAGTVSNRVGKSPGGCFQRSVPYDTSCKSVQGRCGGPCLYIPMPSPPCKLRVLLSHRHALRHGILQAAWQSLIEMGNARMACWETVPTAWYRMHSTQYQQSTHAGPQQDSGEMPAAHQSSRTNWPVSSQVELWQEGPKGQPPNHGARKRWPRQLPSSQPARFWQLGLAPGLPAALVRAQVVRFLIGTLLIPENCSPTVNHHAQHSTPDAPTTAPLHSPLTCDCEVRSFAPIIAAAHTPSPRTSAQQEPRARKKVNHVFPPYRRPWPHGLDLLPCNHPAHHRRPPSGRSPPQLQHLLAPAGRAPRGVVRGIQRQVRTRPTNKQPSPPPPNDDGADSNSTSRHSSARGSIGVNWATGPYRNASMADGSTACTDTRRNSTASRMFSSSR